MIVTAESEALQTRETLFVPADLYNDQINCGDDRPSDLEGHINIFGGVLFPAYTAMVLCELHTPGTSGSFMENAGTVTRALKDSGVQHPGVHSDANAEQGSCFDEHRTDGTVGCGFGQARAIISGYVRDNGAAIIEEATVKMPWLFDNDQAQEFAEKVVATHESLAGNADTIIGNGRQAICRAVAAGADVGIFRGPHTATFGVINTQSNTKFQTNRACAESVPAYTHNLWASDQLLAMLPDAPDETEARIASVIDVIGTMKVLGVEEIAVR